MEIARVGGMYSKSDRARGGKSLREIRFSDSAIKDVIHCNPRRISNHITIPSPLNFYNISFTTKKKTFLFFTTKELQTCIFRNICFSRSEQTKNDPIISSTLSLDHPFSCHSWTQLQQDFSLSQKSH